MTFGCLGYKLPEMSQVDWNNSDFQLYENGTPLHDRKKNKTKNLHIHVDLVEKLDPQNLPYMGVRFS